MFRKKLFALFASFGLLIALGAPALAGESGDGFNPIEVEGDTPSSAASAASTASQTSSAKPDTSNLDSQLAQLRQQSKAIQGNIDVLRKDKSGEAAVNKEISAKAANVQGQIDIINTQIADLETNITTAIAETEALNQAILEKEQAIVQKQAEYDTSFDAFKSRLVALYIAGDTSTLEVLLGAEDFSDMLSNSQYLRFIAEKDLHVMTALVDTKNEIIADKTLVEEHKTEVETQKAQLALDKESAEAKRSEQAALKADLKKLKDESDQELYAINQELAGKESEKKLVEAEAAKLESEIQKLISAGSDTTSPYVGGSMAWPVPGAYTISMPYMGYKGHTGMDITASTPGKISGMGVVAANGGTVIATIRGYSGYGHYIIIDHGGGTSTLYAHLSSISVSKGDKVARGQTIGAAGNTGNSTGAHLHFEVRLSGQHVNPAGYVKG